jgi:hypothetical protein
VAVADFNGDGIPDLAVGGSGVSTLLGNGDGTFQAAVHYSAGSTPHSVAVGDFNRDGIPGLAVANDAAPSGAVSVLLGNGDGTFQAAVKYTTGSQAAAVAVADLNGDGNLDLAVTVQVSNKVNVLLGKGDGTFQAAVNYSAGGGDSPAPRSLLVGDFNGDGVPDLAAANSTVSVLLGKGDGTFRCGWMGVPGSLSPALTSNPTIFDHAVPAVQKVWAAANRIHVAAAGRVSGLVIQASSELGKDEVPAAR